MGMTDRTLILKNKMKVKDNLVLLNGEYLTRGALQKAFDGLVDVIIRMDHPDILMKRDVLEAMIERNDFISLEFSVGEETITLEGYLKPLIQDTKPSLVDEPGFIIEMGS